MLLISALVVTTAACELSDSSGRSVDPLDDPAFQAAVEEVEQAGLTPYWLGEQFRVESAAFTLLPEAEVFTSDQEIFGLQLWYEGGVSTTAPLYVKSLIERTGEGDVFRRRLTALAGTRVEEVQVGEWRGELYTLTSDPRPVRQQWLFVDTGDIEVVASAHAVVNGIPGEDPAVLLDKDLLISVMAEHLRPYPE